MRRLSYPPNHDGNPVKIGRHNHIIGPFYFHGRIEDLRISHIAKRFPIHVPTCLTGQIITLPPFSFCMDGVQHAILAEQGEPSTVRIKGRSPEIQAELEKWADTKSLVPITVCGYFEASIECSHYLSVYSVTSGR